MGSFQVPKPASKKTGNLAKRQIPRHGESKAATEECGCNEKQRMFL